MCQDILYKAARKYSDLKNIAYEIVLGRKGITYELLLHFPYESFFHLTGIQHLTDLKFTSTNKERIFKDILSKKITNTYLMKSLKYEDWHIEERIKNLYLIENIIESNKVMYKINHNSYMRYTRIVTDFLLEYKISDFDIFYLFIVAEKNFPRFEKEYKGCSFFKKYNTDYTIGTSKTTLLLLNKIRYFNTDSEQKTLIYRNKSYK